MAKKNVVEIPAKYRSEADPQVQRIDQELAKVRTTEEAKREFVDAEAALSVAEDRLAEVEARALIGASNDDEQATARDAVARAEERVEEAKKLRKVTDRQRTALLAARDKAESAAASRIAEQLASEIRQEAKALSALFAEAETHQERLNELSRYSEAFELVTVTGFTFSRVFTRARFGNVLFLARAFRDFLTPSDDNSLVSQWRRELAGR
jgi:hypothetical protein